jgi:ornithine cyclodeaminase
MLQLSELQVNEGLNYAELIEALRIAFQEEYTVPIRHHHDFENPNTKKDSTLLLMPAWQAGKYLGIKNVIVSPDNQKLGLPAIHGVYLLFDATTGQALLQCDARTLTKKRTAAASALAASFLARPDTSSMLMIGTGALAPELIQAHASVRPIREVWLWGRRFEQAKLLAATLNQQLDVKIRATKNISDVISEVDLISTATLSPQPLVQGARLSPGQHIDLVGSYKPDMREADDLVIHKAQVYVDTLEGATKETGDIVIPIKRKVLSKNDIQGDLFSLCQNQARGRQKPNDITLFKSVGHALEDLAAAQLLYQHLV